MFKPRIQREKGWVKKELQSSGRLKRRDWVEEAQEPDQPDMAGKKSKSRRMS